MGGKNMYRVMDALEGVDITIPDDKKSATGDRKLRHIDSNELMLLLAIAKRQPDSTENFPDSECICYGDVTTMSAVSHIARASVYRMRDNLTKAGLITYQKNGKFFDFNNPNGKRKNFTNVYKLNWAKILALNTEVMQGVKKVSHGDESVSHGDESVAGRDKKVSHGDEKVSGRDTKIKESNEENNSSSSKKENPTATATDSLADSRTAYYFNYLKVKAKLSDEQARQIDKGILKNLTGGKQPKEVTDAIDDAIRTCGDAMGDFARWIRLVMSKIKKVQKSETPLNAEEMEKTFSQPIKIEKQKENDPWQYVRKVWVDLVRELGLDRLPDEERTELWNAYRSKLRAKNPLYVDHHAGIFASNLLFDAKRKTFAEMREQMSLEEIVKLIKDEIADN